MKHIVRNLRQFITENRLIFSLFVLCQVVCVIVMLFAQGVFQSYSNEKTKRYEPYEDNFPIDFGTQIDEYGRYNDRIPITKFIEVVNKIPEEAKGELVGFVALSEDYKLTDGKNKTKVNFILRIEYTQDGGIKPYSLAEKNAPVYAGRSITPEEFTNGDNVIVIPYDYLYFYDMDVSRVLDKEVTIWGKKYKIVGVDSDSWSSMGYEIEEPELLYDAYMPPGAMDDSVKVKSVQPILTISNGVMNLLTHKTYAQIKKVFEDVFGKDYVHFPEIETVDSVDIKFYNSVIVIAVIIAIICAVNLAILYRYILTTRMRILGVFRLCGCSVRKARRMCVCEVMLISLVLTGISVLLYFGLILPWLPRFYEYIDEAYSFNTCALLIAILLFAEYIAINIAAVIQLKKAPAEIFKRGGK